MDNDQDNQQQPGQSFQPGQQITPQQQPAPQQPVQQVPDPQQQPQQVPQQPQYPPQQQFQQPQQPGQPVQPAVSVGTPVNKKLIAIVGGGFLIVALLIVVITSSLGGGSLAISPTSNDKVSFNVSLPEGWEVTPTVLTFLTGYTAKPVDAVETDETSISITRDITETSKERFIASTEAQIEQVGTPSYAQLFGQEITNLSSESYGSDELPAYRLTLDRTSGDSNQTYTVDAYFLYQKDGSIVTLRGVYSDSYSSVSSTMSSILASYSLKSN